MWGVASGPPTSDLFTHDPKGNTTVININPTSLRANSPNTISGSLTSTAGVPKPGHHMLSTLSYHTVMSMLVIPLGYLHEIAITPQVIDLSLDPSK